MYKLNGDIKQSLDRWTATSVDFRISITHFFDEMLPEGFYAYNFTRDTYSCFSRGTYFIVSSEGSVHLSRTNATWGVKNKQLIDTDCEEILIGVYFNDVITQTKNSCMTMIFDVAPFKNFVDDDGFYFRTQSPTFFVPPFPAISHFHHLHRATPYANGLDIALTNIPDVINPLGNVVLKLGDAFRFVSSGWLILRSRFIRAGLSLHVLMKEKYVLLTNNSRKVIHLTDRIFQFVPFSNFNGDNLTNPKNIYNWASISTREEYKEGDILLGDLYICEKKKKSKINEYVSSRPDQEPI